MFSCRNKNVYMRYPSLPYLELCWYRLIIYLYKIEKNLEYIGTFVTKLQISHSKQISKGFDLFIKYVSNWLKSVITSPIFVLAN